jgi:acetyl esterase/lipase
MQGHQQTIVQRPPDVSFTLSGGDFIHHCRTCPPATMHAYLPQAPGHNHPRDHFPAILITPGGSYRPGPFGWCKKAEGSDVALWLADNGIVGIVLHYRLPAGRPEVPLSDALAALSTVRSLAANLTVSPSAIGIMGFSAGGHLAALASTRYRIRAQRPDFTMLVYPVVSLENFTHMNSRREFLGSSPSAQKVSAYSADRHVSRDSPPAFLIHARDDRVVPLNSSRLYFDACAAANVPALLVELPSGGHPFVTKPRAWDTAKAAMLAWLCATLSREQVRTLAFGCSPATPSSGVAFSSRSAHEHEHAHHARAHAPEAEDPTAGRPNARAGQYRGGLGGVGAGGSAKISRSYYSQVRAQLLREGPEEVAAVWQTP